MEGKRLCDLWQALLRPFAWCFTTPGWRRFAEWVTGLALNVEEHTITQSVSVRPTAWPPGREAARDADRGADLPGRGQEGDPSTGGGGLVAASGVVAWPALRAASQRSGRSSPSCSAGVL